MFLLGGCAAAGAGATPSAAVTPSAIAADATQQEMASRAVQYARQSIPHLQLVGEPTAMVTRRMTLGEFNARLQGRASDCRDPATPVWLVA